MATLAQNLYRRLAQPACNEYSPINGSQDAVNGYESFMIRAPVKRRAPIVSISVQEVRQLADAMGCRTQSELGQLLGITQSRVSQILSGSHPIKKGPLMALVRALQAKHGQQLSKDVAKAQTESSADRRRTAEKARGSKR